MQSMRSHITNQDKRINTTLAIAALVFLVTVSACFYTTLYRRSAIGNNNLEFDDRGLCLSKNKAPIKYGSIKILAVYSQSYKCIWYTVDNNSKRKISIGEPCDIEVLLDGYWHKIRLKENEAVWSSAKTALGPKSKMRYELKANSLDFELKGGFYRIVKEIHGKLYAGEFTIGPTPIPAELN
ncbi:MAG: hypothetical protein FWG30_04320 [Eubacteriaceae bacterium]|nr:hypothetical protein [Eubacteriaceae bacterium]